MEYQLFFYIQLSAAYSNILQQDYPFYIVLKDHIQIYLVSFQCPRYKNRQLTIANYHLLSFPLYIRKEFQIEKLISLLICQYLKVYVRPLLFQIISPVYEYQFPLLYLLKSLLYLFAIHHQ